MRATENHAKIRKGGHAKDKVPSAKGADSGLSRCGTYKTRHQLHSSSFHMRHPCFLFEFNLYLHRRMLTAIGFDWG
jgi:hypothetical protein